MRRPILDLAVVVAVCALTPAVVRADGKTFGGLDYSALAPVTQGAQRAAIVHRNGYQDMVIAVSLGLQDKEKAVWVFPVPGTPQTVSLDVVDEFPAFWGRDPIVAARAAASEWTWDLMLPLFGFNVLLKERTSSLAAGLWGPVEVHGVVNKWGIQAQMLTAPSVEALADHLLNLGTHISAGQLADFKPYLTDCVLVVVHIASREEVLANFPHVRLQPGQATCEMAVRVRTLPDRAALLPDETHSGLRRRSHSR